MQELVSGTLLQSCKYRIICVLGQGGFGITYLAENALLEKRVAIKEFFPKDFCGRDATGYLTLGTQNNADTVARLKERFVKEAKNIAKLDHPGIVRIHDIFEENNTAYYVMDYIEGESLSDIVKRSGPLPEGKAVEYIVKVGESLEYIHSQQMTHFDVKPANIMVRRSDDQPILIDFGLSKQYDTHGDATSTLMQAVSHGYSPIELYNLGSVTTFSPQTDVYSLGATLYYLLTGIVPPNASDLVEDRLSFPAVFPKNLQDAIEKAMSVRKRDRYFSSKDFIIALSEYLLEEHGIVILSEFTPSNKIKDIDVEIADKENTNCAYTYSVGSEDTKFINPNLDEIEIRREANNIKENLEPKQGCLFPILVIFIPGIFLAAYGIIINIQLDFSLIHFFMPSVHIFIGGFLEALILSISLMFGGIYTYDKIKEHRVRKWKQEHLNDPRSKYL